jgi:uncharacterized protein involved in type VI secretion and phage assembly
MDSSAATFGLQDTGLADVIERLRNRFFGKYRGVVSEVDSDTLRIKATVPAVLGDQASGWARACTPYAGPKMGFAFLPSVGAGVWIEFEGGDVSLPIWTGGFWHDGEKPEDASDSVLAIVTKTNQKVLFDLDAGSITVEDDNGNKVVLDSDGISLSRGGQSVALSTAKVSVNDGALEVI